MEDKNRIEKALPFAEKRHFIRHPICFPVAYKIIKKGQDSQTKEKERSSSTINISLGGLLFSARQVVDAGAIILLRLPFQDKIFNVRARVVHCEKSTSAKLYNIGVSFYRIQDAFKTKLIEQIYLISEFCDLWSMQLGREVSLEEASREWIKRYSARFRRLYW